MSSAFSNVPEIDSALADMLLARLSDVEAGLHQCIAIEDTMVNWTARHLMDAGGKRVRPMLTLLGASFGDPHRSAVTDVCVLVELTHLASLYHDDVMDSAPTRRGTSSAHEMWGNNVAILTGDFLFARASALSSRLGTEAVALHSQTFERLCLGQLHETVGPADGQDPFEHYLDVLADKTASLIALAGQLGAHHGGADDEIAETMRLYGEKVGVAFQLADDVLDLVSDASGKQAGTDLREGVPTMPTLLLRRRAAAGDSRAQSLVERLDGDLSTDEDLAELVAELRQDDCVQEAQALADQRGSEALAVLDALPDGTVRDALRSFTTTLVSRSA